MKEFAEQGYENANTNEICKIAAVSKGLLFHYFGTKQNLYISTCEKCINDIADHFEPLRLEEEDFTLAILSYYRLRMKFFREHPTHYKVLMRAINNTPKEMKADIEQKLAEVNELAEGVLQKQFSSLQLKEGVRRETALKLLIMVLSMIETTYAPMLYGTSAFSNQQYEKVEEECRELIRLTLYGIAREASY